MKAELRDTYICFDDYKIYRNDTIFSEELIDDCQMGDLESLLFSGSFDLVFLCSDTYRNKKYLIEVDLQEIKERWVGEFSNNLCLDDEGCELDSFKNGYFYYPEVWTTVSNEKILVLHYNH